MGVGTWPAPARLRVSGAITIRFGQSIWPTRIGSNNIAIDSVSPGFVSGNIVDTRELLVAPGCDGYLIWTTREERPNLIVNIVRTVLTNSRRASRVLRSPVLDEVALSFGDQNLAGRSC